MTRSRGVRVLQRPRCGKCGAPGRWGETCVLCGANYTESQKFHDEYANPSPALRTAHGQVCSFGGEPHRCHCGGGKAHPCNCYLSAGLECHICGLCDCAEHAAE